MALNEKALAVIQRRRAEIDRQIAELDLDLIRAWVTAWDTLGLSFDAALLELVTQAQNGRLKGTTVARNLRLREALQQATDMIDRLAANAEVSAIAAARRVALDGAQSQIDAIAAQLPPEMEVGLDRNWTRVNPDALEAIVARTAERIHAEFYPLSDDAVAAMKAALVQGITVGENPRRVAKDMLRRAEKNFNGGLNRAMIIARTEILDAHRAANKAAEKGNEDVLKGWIWIASLDSKTCPSCIGQHGSEHPLTEDGPLDHHQGRCDRAPLTKSWKDLGFDIEEPPSIIPDAEEWFAGLTPDTQRRIMGPTRLELLQSGDITFKDLSTRRVTDGWRDAMHVTPVRDLRNLGG